MCPPFIVWTMTVFLSQAPLPESAVAPPPSAEEALTPPPPADKPLPPSHPPLGKSASRFGDLPDVVSRLDLTPDLKESPKTFDIATNIASIYADANRTQEAAFYFGQAWQKTARARELLAKLKPVDAGLTVCEGVEAGKAFEEEWAKAEAKKPKEMQAACVRLFAPKVLETGKQLALFQMLSRDVEGAKKTWEALLVLEEDSLEASYALGVLLLETEGDNLNALKRAEKLLQTITNEKHPFANTAQGFLSRVQAAIEAGGNSKVQRPRAQAFKPSGLTPQ